MEIELKFPVTMQERIELGPDIVRFPGTWEEFWELLEVAQYNVEFQNNEILAMSYESDPHGRIASSLLRILGNIFMENDSFVVHDMNRPIYIPVTGAVYNPDASVVSEPGEKYEYRPGMNAEISPVILIEVLSKTTRDHDLEDKLPAYKTIPGIQYIIYVENRFPYVTLFAKNAETGQWTNTVFDELDTSFEIANTAISLREIYRKVNFLDR